MKPESPEVSICIPVRNGKDFLHHALSSALTQTYGDYEIVIVDNASTDGTMTIIEGFAEGNPKIRIFKNADNIGLVGNFNACLRLARGKYIKFLCADDFLMPSCLEKMAAALSNHPAATLAVSPRLLVDEHDRTISKLGYAEYDTVISGTAAINRCLFGNNYIGEPTAVMFRREDASRGFREDLAHLLDLEMWFHLLEKGDLINIDEPLCAIRRHGGQMTFQSIKSGALLENNILLFEEYGKKEYITHSWAKHASRRIRMAYRVWISRKFISPAQAKEIVKRHSFPLVYWFMPMAVGMLTLGRSIAKLWRQ